MGALTPAPPTAAALDHFPLFPKNDVAFEVPGWEQHTKYETKCKKGAAHFPANGLFDHFHV